MNKQDLVNKVAEQFSLSKKQAGQIVDFIFGDIMNAVRSGGEATVAGFGSFRLAYRKARMGINPKSGERISIPAKRAPKFRAAKAFSEMVK